MKKVAIVGGGASGLMCAYIIKKELKRLPKPTDIEVTIYERNERIGKKINATGNGKCNLSNEYITSKEAALFYNTPLIAPVLEKVTPEYIKETFLELGIITYTDKEGRIYPYSLSSNSILEAFLEVINDLDIKVKTNTQITNITKADKWQLTSSSGTIYTSDILVVATGSIASTKYQDLLAKKIVNFGHSWVPEKPGLCPIRVLEDTKKQNGIRLKAKITVNDYVTKGEVLFKNDGLSGIASFEASRHVKRGDIIHLDLMEGYSILQINSLITSLKELKLTLPKMVALDIIKRSNNDLKKALEMLKDYQFTCKELYGFEFAQIMRGGINLKDIDLNSFASKLIDNLYIIGETLNVDGTTGGYNLHFAWASGILAAKSIVKK